ncbi:8-amino-7-oxononanoate synthase [Breoghania corrubedonensis]|uniref:8-amino-7-oxononanoate synthase n=1 Tax=Breoghania corrubedonensis TaxID=665038 RepID=A0A2T5VB31_9HYPH|nr:aminotransferase class I/II-fold pyridoxal phosphate-dependent enzyme [Breoghania corrubedonensis]PTW60958.1 8-amino-7-oxononanoate synthase [Breoghania corrubedonensis]
MSGRRGIGGLSGGDRDKLMQSLRAGRKSAQDTRTAAPKRPEAAPAFDFATLPEVKQLKMQRAAADMIGVANPFFRAHDATAGACTEIDGRSFDNFASYNYLGLSGHREVIAAANAATQRYGTSVSASRVVAGERPIHRELEAALARLHGVEDAMTYVSGHATNVSTIGHLLGPDDLILTDVLIHNSIAEGARLAGAKRLNFPHGDLDALERQLASNRHMHTHVLIAVEGLYSMDGDFPDLKRLVALKNRYNAWLLVDEAHSLGVLGAHGHGIAEEFGIDPKSVEIWMGTLSKTLASCGGYIAGSSALCDYLKATAPGFVYSVGMAPPLAAAALASAGILEREPDRVARLKSNGHHFLKAAAEAGLDTGPSAGYSVIPVIVGDSIQAAMLANALLEDGINALPIIFPAVAENAARLRFFITCDHTAEQIERAVACTAHRLAQIRAGGSGLKALMDRAR